MKHTVLNYIINNTNHKNEKLIINILKDIYKTNTEGTETKEKEQEHLPDASKK